MTLYATDVMDLAKPVKKKAVKMITPPASESESTTPPEKKPRTEKQLAAFEKAKETRKRNKEAREEATRLEQEQAQAQAAQQQQALEAAEAKKEERKQKRKLAALKRKELTQDIDQAVLQVQSEKPHSSESASVPELPKPKVKRTRMKRNPEDPPAWFQKYMEGVAREQGDKKPVKQIQQEAQELAKSKWEDGLVRDRLTNEVDAHMNRMYSMIFGRR